MDEQLGLLADAVERTLSEPFTVRKLVILSPYARGRSAGGNALADATADARLTSRLGTSIDDSTCFRWRSVHDDKLARAEVPDQFATFALTGQSRLTLISAA